jgi:UDP-glucose:(heptosyl)LPS alpha-1,3-glucosyltransferase
MSRRANPNPPKRVAVVVPRYGLIGGGERLVRELTERLAADPRWQVHVFANRWLAGTDAIAFHRVPILLFPRFLKPLSFALFARKKIDRVGIDLIHAHERILNAHVYSVHGIPHPIWVKEIRGKRVMNLYDHTLARIEKRLVESPDCRNLLAVSSITAQKMNQAFSGIAGRIDIVAPGVDTAPFGRRSRAACRSDVRRRHGWSANDVILLFVGMNFEVKGLDTVLQALRLARDANPSVSLRLLVVGKGDIGKYRRIANAYNLGTRVAFTGPVDAEIEGIYLGCDLFLLLSRFDTFGLVVLEAMAAGLPVIVSRNVGARDVVRHGCNGFVVDAQRERSVADRIGALAQPDRRQRMGRAAAATARRHSWEAMADKVGDIYARRLRLGESVRRAAD